MDTVRRTLLIAYKLVFAGAGLWAVINEIMTLMARGRFVPANFFSFFTIQSNLVATAAFLVGAYAVVRCRTGPGIDALRGAATLYMALTGVVFVTLLSNYPSLTAVPLDNLILHYVIPVAIAIDWLVDRPSAPIGHRALPLWLAYPLAYLAYTLVRGPLVGWYPYPFLNPAYGGYGRVALTSAIITVGVIVAGLLVRAWSLRRHSSEAA